MTQSAVPPGLQHERELVKQLDEAQAAADGLQAALPFVNDPRLRTHAEALAKGMATVLAAHRDRPGPDVADDLAGLMSAARALRVPAQDAELGRTQTLQGLRAAKGLIVVALADALDAARALGLYPRQAPLPQELSRELSRSDNQELFQGITRRLDEVARSLDALEMAKAEPTTFPQQTGLLNFYIGAMRVQVDLAGLHLTVGEEAIDFGALARAVEKIGELTGDFIATIRAWVSQVSDAVARVAEYVRTRVRRLAAGISTAAKWIGHKARFAPHARVEPGHPSQLDERVGEMELSFDPNDPECIAQATEISFGQAGRVQRSSLATSIRVRVHAISSITLKNVMAYITKIEKLTDNGEWQESNSPHIQLTWTDTDNFVTDIPGSDVKYANVVHISSVDNRISVWRTPMPLSVMDFVKDLTTYRFRVSVVAGEVRHTGIEVDWKGQWDNIQVRSATHERPPGSPLSPVAQTGSEDNRVFPVRYSLEEISGLIKAGLAKGDPPQQVAETVTHLISQGDINLELRFDPILTLDTDTLRFDLWARDKRGHLRTYSFPK
jgi:hypothetical protein